MFNGVTKEIKYKRFELCDTCGGSGMTENTRKRTCKSCGGTGTVFSSGGFAGFNMSMSQTCPTCGGKGKIQASILFTDQIEEQIAHEYEQHGRGLILYLHPYVYSYVCRGWLNSLKNQWRRKYGITVMESQALGMLETKFAEK